MFETATVGECHADDKRTMDQMRPSTDTGVGPQGLRDRSRGVEVKKVSIISNIEP